MKWNNFHDMLMSSKWRNSFQHVLQLFMNKANKLHEGSYTSWLVCCWEGSTMSIWIVIRFGIFFCCFCFSSSRPFSHICTWMKLITCNLDLCWSGPLRAPTAGPHGSASSWYAWVICSSNRLHWHVIWVEQIERSRNSVGVCDWTVCGSSSAHYRLTVLFCSLLMWKNLFPLLEPM